MHSTKLIILVLVLSLLLLSCADDGKQSAENKHKVNESASYAPKTALDIEPLLHKTDSLQIVYYDNPDGDSLRYTRFFKHVATKEETVINLLKKQLSVPVEYRNEMKHCRSEGKILTYAGEEVSKVFYFSSRCDSCYYVYFIKDGSFLYMALSDSFNTELKRFHAMAKKQQ